MFKLFVFISTVLTAVAARAESDIFNTTCSPFRLLVIWHTSNGEDHAFIDQKRLIIQLLLDIPQGTEIHVTAINTQLYHLLNFKKDQTKNWIYNISMYNPAILENHIIKGSLINETVFTFRKQNDKKEVAELTILVVSEKTLTENSLETIKNIKRCVVFTGLNPPPQFWTSLATDRQHVVMLNMTSESIWANINCAADTVLDLLCQDYSKLSLENADNEANKNVTVECDNEADKNDTGQRDKTNKDRMVLSILIFLTVSATLTVVAVCMHFRKTSRAHDKFELTAQQEILHLNSLKGK